MSAHTPGPWVALCEPTLSRYRIGAGFAAAESVAVVYMAKVDGVTEANARLIAAAPDMLAALREADSLLDSASIEGQTRNMIRAAIAKAEGAPCGQ